MRREILFRQLLIKKKKFPVKYVLVNVIKSTLFKLAEEILNRKLNFF